MSNEILREFAVLMTVFYSLMLKLSLTLNIEENDFLMNVQVLLTYIML